MDLMKALTSQYMKQELPEVQVGDTVRVHVKIKEGSRERIQIFEGTVIAKKHGGINETITVRRISYGVGCEKVFPLHSPNVAMIETVRKGKVRRAKLYYLRDRVGKAAKVKEKVEVRNQADQMVYQSEKTLSEVGDKLPESEKAPIQAGIDKLKETLKGEDTDAIKAATEELTQLFYKMSEKLYQQQAPQGDAGQAGAQGGPTGDQGGQYYDADYKVVDDDDKNK